ncbi:hypothetical protein MSG28_005216 [Choristoneura fumiferana]|uniref:Uncharacterized protein n=1 Tax=Choristoneura fumiferana TaxID=7141 RepID=A0ACC0JQI1_CHOFU|nr:hypothetical protein MSG28_005216 [Choristoneura fumiferana]
MIAKFVIVFALAVAATNAGVLPLAAAPAALVAPAAYAVAPYASSYSAHSVNHAVATPVVAPAPLVAAAPAPVVAAAPYVAAPAAVAPSPYFARYFSSPYIL